VEEGASAATLWAKADTGTVDATFAVVGVNTEVSLGTSWQQVVIDLSAVDYNSVNVAGGVNTGLVVVLQRQTGDTAPRTIYFDEVHWVP
jgi:hypothetical protein